MGAWSRHAGQRVNARETSRPKTRSGCGGRPAYRRSAALLPPEPSERRALALRRREPEWLSQPGAGGRHPEGPGPRARPSRSGRACGRAACGGGGGPRRGALKVSAPTVGAVGMVATGGGAQVCRRKSQSGDLSRLTAGRSPPARRSPGSRADRSRHRCPGVQPPSPRLPQPWHGGRYDATEGHAIGGTPTCVGGDSRRS